MLETVRPVNVSICLPLLLPLLSLCPSLGLAFARDRDARENGVIEGSIPYV